MNMPGRLTILFSVALLTACTSGASDSGYLRRAQDHETRDQIRERWGEPKNVRVLENGEMVWVYEKKEHQAGNRYTAPGMWCDEYALNFDQGGILRRWIHRSEFHGGEVMPQECITGTPRPKDRG